MIRVAAIDDHPLIRQMIREALGKQADLELVGTAEHGRDLMALVRRTQPDVLILDLKMAEGVFEPVRAVQDLSQEFPEVQVLVLTGDLDQANMRALVQAGVRGYVLKSDQLSLKLPEGIRKVYQRQRFVSESVLDALFFGPGPHADLFSPQERVVLRLLAQGVNNRGISSALNLSYGRVRNILSEMYAKANLDDLPDLTRRDALLAKARALGLLDWPA